MTTRLFSVLRRKPGLIDLVIKRQPFDSGVNAYRLKSDSSLSAALSTTVMTVPSTGYVDPDVAGAHNVIQPGDDVRVIFKPSNFGLGDGPIWLQLVYVDDTNTEMLSPGPSAPTLIAPPSAGPEQMGFTGTAPSNNPLRIDFPRAMDNVRVLNLDLTESLVVAFQEGGQGVLIPAGHENRSIHGLVSSIWVSGSNATVDFTVTMTPASPR